MLDIVQIGFPVLRETAQAVESPESPDIQTFIDDLMETLDGSNGVGIAAPQVGVSLRIFIVIPITDPHGPVEETPEPVVMINPEITTHSPEIVKDWEGCLSVPGLRGLVPRFTSVTMRYMDRRGIPHEREFDGFSARICQHEYDHLEGLVYLDRVEDIKEVVSDDYYRFLMSNI